MNNATLPTLAIDLGETGAPIKPLHGLNRIDAPSAWFDNPQYALMREVGIPFNRLHDLSPYCGGRTCVDISSVFRDFDADENDPANYEFAFTDFYLEKVAATGAKPFFRLGETIENYAPKIKPLYINPPADMAKWARICEHIVRHYNEGWANGFEMGIEYWEIWNEPENRQCWTGNFEQYCELYRVTATHLKKCFPNIKVGGPVVCAPENAKGYARRFFQEITTPGREAPIDFFSWHCYTYVPERLAEQAEIAAAILRDLGLEDKVESICDEWNLGWWGSHEEMNQPSHGDVKRGPVGAAYVSAAFCVLQASTVSKSIYYDGRSGGAFGGLFDPLSLRPTCTYFAFKAFNELYRLGSSVKAEVRDAPGVFALAATDGKGIAFANMLRRSASKALVVNYSAVPVKLALSVSGIGSLLSCRAIAADGSGLVPAPELVADGGLALPPWAVVLLSW